MLYHDPDPDPGIAIIIEAASVIVSMLASSAVSYMDSSPDLVNNGVC